MRVADVEVRISANTVPFEVAVLAVQIGMGMRMIPIVVLVQDDDLEQLNRHLAPIVEGIEANPRATQICRDHGWTSEQLAWSRLLHSAATALA